MCGQRDAVRLRALAVQVDEHVGSLQRGRERGERRRVDERAAGQLRQRCQRARSGDGDGRRGPRVLQRAQRRDRGQQVAEAERAKGDD